MNAIVLVGMMGSGKTTIGKALASFLGVNFYDLDSVIEENSGESIYEIFEKYGEKSFRDLENSHLKKILNENGKFVLSCGGGIIENYNNLELLKSANTIYLKADMEEIKKRLKNDTKRPLIKNSLDVLEEIYLRRKEKYELFPFFDNSANDTNRALALLLYKLNEKYDIQNFIPSSIILDSESQVSINNLSIFDYLRNNVKSGALFTCKDVAEIYNYYLGGFEKYVLENGEIAKEKESLFKIFDILIEKNVSKTDILLALGGGTITDIIGLCASIYKRGMKHILLPTTLLAQIDAAIGGKTAINYGGIKNIVGSIYFPNEIIIDPIITLSNSDEIFFDGLIEGLKVTMLTKQEEEFYEQFEIIKKLHESKNIYNLNLFINNSVMNKLSVVKEDRYENSKRMYLNFGHTFGHVFETTYNISHGKAVAMGMYKILKEKKNIKYFKVIKFLESVIEEDLLKKCNQKLSEEMMKKLANDKKIRNGKINFIDLEEFGKPIIIEKDVDSIHV